jgi:hypothetical protein
VFNQFGDLERCSLRPGNVHSADGWDVVLKPVVARYQGKVSRIYFRADAGFANPGPPPTTRRRRARFFGEARPAAGGSQKIYDGMAQLLHHGPAAVGRRAAAIPI